MITNEISGGVSRCRENQGVAASNALRCLFSWNVYDRLNSDTVARDTGNFYLTWRTLAHETWNKFWIQWEGYGKAKRILSQDSKEKATKDFGRSQLFSEALMMHVLVYVVKLSGCQHPLKLATNPISRLWVFIKKALKAFIKQFQPCALHKA